MIDHALSLIDIKTNNFRKWTESILEEIYDSLLEELPLADNAPGGMIKYRRSLTLRYDINPVNS